MIKIELFITIKRMEKIEIPNKLIINLDLISGNPITFFNCIEKIITKNSAERTTAIAAPSILNVKINTKFNTTLTIVAIHWLFARLFWLSLAIKNISIMLLMAVNKNSAERICNIIEDS